MNAGRRPVRRIAFATLLMATLTTGALAVTI